MTPRSGITPGIEWSQPGDRAPDLHVHGGDSALAAAIAEARSRSISGDENDAERAIPLAAWTPSADAQLARALGIVPGATPSGRTVLLDALTVTLDGRTPLLAVNAVVVGRPPHRVRWWHRRTVVDDAGSGWGAVVANGQFVDDFDVVPRGHPGDGRAELQVYAVEPAQRAQLRRRLRSGSHLPHPAIRQRPITTVMLAARRGAPVTVDGVDRGRVRSVEVRVDANAFRLVV